MQLRFFLTWTRLINAFKMNIYISNSVFKFGSIPNRSRKQTENHMQNADILEDVRRFGLWYHIQAPVMHVCSLHRFAVVCFHQILLISGFLLKALKKRYEKTFANVDTFKVCSSLLFSPNIHNKN